MSRVLDGADWLIEGRREDIYRAVSRWSPRSALRRLGALFFELAGLPLAEVGIYLIRPRPDRRKSEGGP